MSKFVGGLITGSVLTLVGIGIAAAISDGTLSNPFEAWDVLSGDDDDDDSEEDTEKKEKEKDDSPNKEDIKEKAEKTGGILGAGLATLLNAAAAGAESFEKSLSEEIENSVDSDGEEDSE